MLLLCNSVIFEVTSREFTVSDGLPSVISMIFFGVTPTPVKIEFCASKIDWKAHLVGVGTPDTGVSPAALKATEGSWVSRPKSR